MLWLLSGPQGFTCWISFAPVVQFYALAVVGPSGVYVLDFFCSSSSVLFTVESLSLLYLLFIS